MNRPSLLEVESLSVSFRMDRGVARAVDRVSLRIDAGESVGIVGESGCGKTVTALSLLGLIPTPPGEVDASSSIRWKGEELVGISPRRLRALRGNEMAMIFQEPMSSLNPVLRIGTQIGEALTLHRGVDGRRARKMAVDLLGEVGIPEPARRVDEYPHQLSGGMRQRVMIAIALSCEPALLIADEPTTALDVTIQAQILDLLRELRQQRGMALLLITHDLAVVAESCDRVLVMYGGQIVETGPVSEVFRHPRHPYTQGLLNSLPLLGSEGHPLRPIPGRVPSPFEWPIGCRFIDRCNRRTERCAEPPPLFRPSLARTHRCWLEQGGEAGEGWPGEAPLAPGSVEEDRR